MMNFERAQRIALNPTSYSLREVRNAFLRLHYGGTPQDQVLARLLYKNLERRSLFRRWLVICAVIVTALAAITIGFFLVDVLVSDADREALLRFIAPTAFETRPIEEIIEGARGYHE